MFSLRCPHFGQWISRSPRGSMMMVAAQNVQGRPSLSRPDQAAALAFPVADRVLDELQRAVLPQVGDREDALEHRLQPGVLAVRREHAHLQEALVGVLLDLDEVRDRDRGVDLLRSRPVPGRCSWQPCTSALLPSGTKRAPARDTTAPGGASRHRHRESGRIDAVDVPTFAVSEVLLDLDRGPDFLELLLDGRRLVLGDAFLDDLGRAVDQVLGLLEAEARDLADDLDDVDLLVAGRS